MSFLPRERKTSSHTKRYLNNLIVLGPPYSRSNSLQRSFSFLHPSTGLPVPTDSDVATHLSPTRRHQRTLLWLLMENYPIQRTKRSNELLRHKPAVSPGRIGGGTHWVDSTGGSWTLELRGLKMARVVNIRNEDDVASQWSAFTQESSLLLSLIRFLSFFFVEQYDWGPNGARVRSTYNTCWKLSAFLRDGEQTKWQEYLLRF